MTSERTMSAAVAESVERLPPSLIRELANVALGMDDVIPLYFGESNLPTPQLIKDAAAKAMNDGYTYYTENTGIPSLRREIAESHRRLQGVELDPESEIMVTSSGVHAIHNTVRAVLDPGDEALVLTPVWPNGSGNARLANATPIHIPHPLVDGRFTIDFDALEAAVTPRTKLLLYTSPSNPLGWVATDDEQDRLLEFCRKHSLWLMADEVYERLYYLTDTPGTPAPSILRKATRDDAVIVIQSFSKAYCMTGWRIGWFVARSDLVERVGQMNEFVVSCAPHFAQVACETALQEGEAEVEKAVSLFRANRDLCLEALRAIPGVTVPSPDGAFYLFPRIDGVEDSFEFCRRLLLEWKVGVAPGVAFEEGGEGSIRICYASEPSVLEPALERLDRFIRAGG
ncbi:MAG: pyridoxal phosphate-dependent aminotransferase [Gaiellaceae bacterium]